MSASLFPTKLLMRRGLTCTANAAPAAVMSSSRSMLAGKDATGQSRRAASSFTYRIAAASAPKRGAPRPPKLGHDFWNYASSDPHTNPPYLTSTKRMSGEDAFFASTVGSSRHDVAFGVADGVGGWQDSGVDPSVYSQALCGLMAGTARTYEGHDTGKVLRPKELLQIAYSAVMGNPRIQAGGCTASLAVLSADGNMESANLGDSGFVVISPGRVVHRSTPQTHAFNTPYQLSKIPAKMQQQYAIFGGATHFSETPAQADVAAYQLQHGDVVLFATDGVWDNISAQDTLQIVARIMYAGGYWSSSSGSGSSSNNKNSVSANGAETRLNASLIHDLPARNVDTIEDAYLPGQLARAVMHEAKVAGLDRKRNGPFAKEVNLRYPHEGWRGGKPDDIAVVACVAVDESAARSDDAAAPVKAKL